MVARIAVDLVIFISSPDPEKVLVILAANVPVRQGHGKRRSRPRGMPATAIHATSVLQAGGGRIKYSGVTVAFRNRQKETPF
jgi:hypothetical protein